MISLASGNERGRHIIPAILLVCAIGFLSVAPKQAHAQAATGVVFSPLPEDMPASISQSPRTSQRYSSTSRLIGSGNSPSGKQHVLVGAGVGAVVGAVFAVSQLAAESMVPPVIVVSGGALVGAGAGALVGYLVYLARR